MTDAQILKALDAAVAAGKVPEAFWFRFANDLACADVVTRGLTEDQARTMLAMALDVSQELQP